MSVTFTSTNIEVDPESGDGSVNLANGNCALVLGRLGIEPEPWGEMQAEEFRALVAIALAGLDAEVVDDSGTAPATHGNMTDCGHRPGYFRDVMERLDGLAAVPGIISWG